MVFHLLRHGVRDTTNILGSRRERAPFLGRDETSSGGVRSAADTNAGRPAGALAGADDLKEPSTARGPMSHGCAIDPGRS
jgi:hypothetical protein